MTGQAQQAAQQEAEGATAPGAAPVLAVVLDCRDPEALAPFWEAALSYATVGAVANYTMLVPDGRPGPRLLLQRVAEGKVGKNRMHIDIDVDDIEATARRLEDLGARRLEADARSEAGCHFLVMADPEGNEFCVCGRDTC